MAKIDVIKQLVMSILHFKDCKVEKSLDCKECIEAATRLSNTLYEGMEAAEGLRRILATAPVPGGK